MSSADGVDGEFAAFLHIPRGNFDERVAMAQRLKAEGNALLNQGDFEDALPKYAEGLYHLQFHDRALSMVPSVKTDLNVVRIPLLLNSVLCELKMNPEEQTRRLYTAERRIADVLAEQPDNQKAHFRHAQLLGRAGELDSAKTLLERLCRQQPTERAFRTELTSVQARLKQTRAETREFWSGVAKGLGVAKVTVDVEDGRTDGERGVAVAAPMGVIATVMACLRRVVLWLWLMVRVWLMAWLRAWQRFRAVCVDERRPHIDEAEHERSL